MPNDSRETYRYRWEARQLYPPEPGELCERCGELKSPLNRHHLDGDIGNNDPANIRKICYSCHNVVEPRRRKS